LLLYYKLNSLNALLTIVLSPKKMEVETGCVENAAVAVGLTIMENRTGITIKDVF